ncbi:hypothetical protein Trydic_g4534, partial [Trypoxylus dichotomus]
GCEHTTCPYDISPPANVTFFAHGSDCSKYCMCDWYSTAHVMDCPDGLYWNTELDTCDWSHNVPRCSDVSASSSTTGSSDAPSSSSTTSTSDPPRSSSSVNPSTTERPVLQEGCEQAACPYDISPPANVTFFPHYTDCGRYCMCDWHGFAHDMACPDGLHWNTALDTCDYPTRAGCIN